MKELKPGKAIKGELRFPGDRLQGQYLCALSLLAQGVSRIGNWSRTPEWDAILAFLDKNGAAVTPSTTELGIAALPGMRERTTWALDAELPQPFATAFLALLSGLSTSDRPLFVSLPPSLRARLAPALDALRHGGFESRDQSESENVLCFFGRRTLRKRPSAIGMRRTLWTLAALASTQPFEFEELGAANDLLENVLPFFDLKLVSLEANEAPDLDPEMAKRLQKRQKNRQSRSLRVPSNRSIPAVDAMLNGDASLASWAALSACLRRGSDVILRDVTLPSCRTAIFTSLRKMGADLDFVKKSEARGVPSGDIRVKASQLLGRKFDGSDLAGLAEAAPFLAMAATHAEKETVLSGLGTLREGSVDVLDGLAANLRVLGLAVGVFPEGLVLRGEDALVADRLDAHEHEGLALALHALGTSTPGKTILESCECLDRICPSLDTLGDTE